MKDHVSDLRRLTEIIHEVQRQIGKTESLEKQPNEKEEFEKEFNTLVSEYKMLMLKKSKIQNDYESSKVRHLGMV